MALPKPKAVALRSPTVVLVAVLLIGAVAGLFLSYERAFSPSPAAARSQGFSGSIVVEWNRELIQVVNTPGVQPAAIPPTRSFAMLNAAMYDAVVATTDRKRPYLFSVTAAPGARPDTAAAEAARDTLAGLYPKQKPVFDGLLERQLTAMPESPATLAGYEAGRVTAALLLDARATDGSNAASVRWSYVAPFVLRTRDQFRPPPPEPVTSPRYSAAVDEVKAIGGDRSTTRTTAETAIAKFWARPMWTAWDEIVGEAAADHHLDLAESARLFAVAGLAFADTTIAVYDAKYEYLVARPLTAIRQTKDPAWTPLITTAEEPSYPDIQSAIAAAGAEILARLLGDRDGVSVTSDAPPRMVRTFSSYAAAANEASLSTIYAGVQTRLDSQAGLDLGRQVADFVLGQSTGTAFGA